MLSLKDFNINNIEELEIMQHPTFDDGMEGYIAVEDDDLLHKTCGRILYEFGCKDTLVIAIKRNRTVYVYYDDEDGYMVCQTDKENILNVFSRLIEELNAKHIAVLEERRKNQYKVIDK